MKHKCLVLVSLAAGLLLGAPLATAAATASDADLIAKVRHELATYTWYTIFDDVNFRVLNGQVELNGSVSQPYKKTDMERLARGIPGVAGVTDDLKVLPLSDFDIRLRLEVARAIYGDPTFTIYRMMPSPPIHIIVDNGHVTLTGVVATEAQKSVAGMRAAAAGLSLGPVVNNLQVECPAKKS